MNRKALERTLDAALSHHRAGRLEDAAHLYTQARRAAPGVYDCWYLSGALALNRDQPAEAIPLLTRALQLAAGGAEASQCRLFLGVALSDVGRHAEAEKTLRSAVAKHPGHDQAWSALARSLEALERPAEAVECLRRVLELAPDREDVRERMARLERAPLAGLLATL